MVRNKHTIVELKPLTFQLHSFGDNAPARKRAIKRGRGKTNNTNDRPPAAAFLTKQRSRECKRLNAASDTLANAFPMQEGDAAHYLLTGYFDPCDLLISALDRLSCPCIHLRIATLSLSLIRNLPQLTATLDAGKVQRLDLLLSRYSADVDPQIALECRAALAPRGQRVTAKRIHCKFVLLHMADGSKYAIHGSANLRSCRCTEQLTFCRDTTVHDFFAHWFDEETTDVGPDT